MLDSNSSFFTGAWFAHHKSPKVQGDAGTRQNLHRSPVQERPGHGFSTKGGEPTTKRQNSATWCSGLGRAQRNLVLH